jgi:hypothetical protein
MDPFAFVHHCLMGVFDLAFVFRPESVGFARGLSRALHFGKVLSGFHGASRLYGRKNGRPNLGGAKAPPGSRICVPLILVSVYDAEARTRFCGRSLETSTVFSV